jgi:hypothetical protein
MDDTDINRSWETITGSIQISAKGRVGYYELKQKKHGWTKDVQYY